jgi:transglutaminase-like putative cysteine protease
VANHTITVDLPDCAAAHDAVALIVPLGIDTEFQRFQSFEVPSGWDTTIVAESRTRQRAAVLQPPHRSATAQLRHTFSSSGSALPNEAYTPEDTALTTAATELAHASCNIARAAGGGLEGISAIVADTSARFDYGQVPMAERWYYGRDAIPIVACTAGNCIDINTYLVAALRAANYDATYLTCYFFDDSLKGTAIGMHCWVRTRHGAITQDWDIAHFKKANRTDVSAMMNPIPGQRFALART